MRVQFEVPAIPDRATAEEVILDIVAVRGGRFESKTLLYKAFYLAHLYYWEEHDGVLTHYPIVKMPNGPGLDDGDQLLAGLVSSGRLTREVEPFGPFHREVFTLVEPRPVDPGSARQEAIRKALAFIGTKSAKQVCDEVHEFSKSWQNGASGAELPIYMDLLTDADMGKLKEASSEVSDLFNRAFG